MTRKDKTSRIADEIDRNLKRAYEEVANEALPSHLTDLLDKLRSQDDGAVKKDSDHE